MVAVYEVYLRKAFGDIFHGAVAGMVVHDIYLRLNAFRCLLHSQQTLLQIEPYLIAYYYNREFQWYV